MLTNTQSDGFIQLLDGIFGLQTSDLLELTFDTDVAAKANFFGSVKSGRNGRIATPTEGLIKAIREIRAGAVDVSSFFAMSNSSLIAATSSLRRAKNAGTIGKGGRGIMKRAAQRAAGVFACAAATSAAVEGSMDGIHGADPRVVENMRNLLSSIFESHGAVHLRSPLLRPRPHLNSNQAMTGPSEMLDRRGTILLLPEDLTVSL